VTHRIIALKEMAIASLQEGSKMIAKRASIAAILIGLTALPVWATPVDDLRRDQDKIERAIAEARIEHDKLSGGLLKSLIAVRLELLRTNAALVQQRIHALESGAKITLTLTGTAPDPNRSVEIEKEMLSLKDRIAAQQAESAKYSGGLVKAMLESGIATSRLSLEMLNAEYLKAKYGIHWLPSLSDGGLDRGKKPDPIEPSAHGEWRQQVSIAEPEVDRAVTVLSPTLTNKRFHKSDWKNGSYEDAIWFDIAWDTSKLRQPARAVKGILVFADLFGEPKFKIRVTIDTPLTPGKTLKQLGLGFKFNQFTQEHQWVRSTDLVNMTFRFETQEVLYMDGTTEKFSQASD